MGAVIELVSMLRKGNSFNLTSIVCAPVTFCGPKKSPKMPFVSLAWGGRLYSLLLVTTSKFFPEFCPSVSWNLHLERVGSSTENPACAGMTRGDIHFSSYFILVIRHSCVGRNLLSEE